MKDTLYAESPDGPTRRLAVSMMHEVSAKFNPVFISDLVIRFYEYSPVS